MCTATGYSRAPTQDIRITRDSFSTSQLFSPYTHHLSSLTVATCELSSLCYVCSVSLDHQYNSNLVISCISYRIKTHKHNTSSKGFYLYQVPSYIVSTILQTSSGLKDAIGDAVARPIASKIFC